MKTLFIFVLAFPLAAQVQVTKSAVTVTATTGTASCTATSAAPPVAVITCVNGTDKPSFNGPIPVGSGSGVTFSFNSSGGAITFLLSLPNAGGPVSYQVAATPTAGCPAGAACTGSGTF